MSGPRRLRRDRRTLRSGAAATLNLVSLIDVFAILVFYLLVNALSPGSLPVPAALSPPQSASRDAATVQHSISIGERELRLDGRLIGALESPDTLPRLRAALAAGPAAGAGGIGIVADRRLPFRVLDEVMSACAGAHYAQVSLAVVDAPKGGA